MLLGPPGTGKTRSILDAWALPALKDHPPGAVLVCTFSKDAAKVLLGRAAEATREDPGRLRSSFRTIHSEALRLVKLGRPGLALYGTKTGKAAAKAAAEADDEHEPASRRESLLVPASDQRAEALRLWELARNIEPDLALRGASPKVLLERFRHMTDGRWPMDTLVAEVESYEGHKNSLDQPDFADLLLWAHHAPAPDRVLLVVDEAQDCTPLQVSLWRTWEKRARLSVVVGDIDQTVHVYAGADFHWLLRLAGDEETVVRRLTKSWRVPVASHREAVALIEMNTERIDAPYEPADREGYFGAISFEQAIDEMEDMQWTGRPLLCLARTASALGRYARALTDRGVPFVSERGGCPWASRAMRELLAVLWMLGVNREPSRALAERLVDTMPARNAQLRRLWFHGGTKKAALERLAETPEPIPVDVLRQRVAIDQVVPHFAPALGAAGRPWVEIGRVLGLLGEKPAEYDPLLLTARWMLSHDVPFDAVPDALLADPHVRLTTMHASKGREADKVIVDLEAPYPVQKDVVENPAAEAERRCLYVALTRARHSTFVVPSLVKRCDLAHLVGAGFLHQDSGPSI